MMMMKIITKKIAMKMKKMMIPFLMMTKKMKRLKIIKIQRNWKIILKKVKILKDCSINFLKIKTNNLYKGFEVMLVTS